MLDAKSIEEMAKRLSDAVPLPLKDMKHDMEKNFHHILQGAFSKLDLVSREEFDAQSAVLAKTREKVSKMEKELTKLESALGLNKKKARVKIHDPQENGNGNDSE